MFGFLGRLFGSDKASEAVVEGISQGIDKLIYTDEEKADAVAEARREGYRVYMAWLESTTGSRVARRLIALIAVGLWALEQLVAQAFAVAGIFSDPGKINQSGEYIAGPADRLAQASDQLFQHAQANNELVGVVLLFYFGGPVAIEGVKGLVNRWVDKGGRAQ